MRMRICKRKLTGTGNCGIFTIAATSIVLWSALVSAAAAPLTTPNQATGTNVSIDNFSFSPMDLTIRAGQQVTWTNRDDVPHTIVSVDHQFKSKALDTDESFSFTFKDSGTYEYFCSVHPRMTGKIVVK
jgi:plastocyanin